MKSEEGGPIRKDGPTVSTCRPRFAEKAGCTHEEQLLVAPNTREHTVPQGVVCRKPEQGEEGGAGVVGERRRGSGATVRVGRCMEGSGALWVLLL